MTDTELELDDTASRALAAIILERTADAIRDGGTGAGDALQGLADDTGFVLDIAAGILQATSWLAGSGGVTAEAVFAASLALQPDTDDTDDTLDEAELAEMSTYAAKCPQCSALRPDETHLDWCTYDGPEPGE